MNRIVRRKELDEAAFAGSGPLRIGVVGLCSGAGCTFVAEAIAYLLAHEKKKAVTYVDAAGYLAAALPYRQASGCIYDALGMEKRFAIRGFTDAFELLESGRSIRKIRNIDEGINWILPKPGARGRYMRGGFRSIAAEEAFSIVQRAYQSCSGEIIICDFGAPSRDYGIKSSETWAAPGRWLLESSVLGEMDCVIAVANPLPSALLAGEPVLSALKALAREDRQEVLFVLNKVSDGVIMHEVKHFLRQSFAARLQAVPIQNIYAAEFACSLPIENKGVRNAVLEDMRKLMQKITQSTQ